MTLLSTLKKSRNYFFAAAAALVVIILSYSRAFELYELQTYDWRYHFRGTRPVDRRITLIEIGDDTITKFGTWPFSREAHKDLIDALKYAEAKAIVFDIIFTDPWVSEDGSKNFDWVFAQAINLEPQNVYLANVFGDVKLSKGRYVADRMSAPVLPAYALVARGTGFVNTEVDIDGKRRRSIPLISYHDHDYLQLGFLVAADALGVNRKEIRLRPRQSLEFSNKLSIPLDEDSCFIVNYASPWIDVKNGFDHYSFVDVLTSYYAVEDPSVKPPVYNPAKKPPIKLEDLKDKICIVGLTATGSHDINPVPLESKYPMMGQYANVINSILTGDFITRLDRIPNALLACLLAALILILSRRLRPIRALWATVGAIILFIATSVLLFRFAGLWIDLFYPIILMAGVYAAATLIRVIAEMRKRQLIENELKIASQIQKSFLPASPPELKDLKIGVFMRPAKAVGGDLYAFIQLPDDKLGVMLGDVSGKGTPAALFMAKTVSEFKFVARDNPDPADVLAKLNNIISLDSTAGLFVTMSYIVLDLKNKKLVISNAGHLPMIHTRQGMEAQFVEAPGGMPIGVMDGVTYETAERPITTGDCFALYSDGISEARNRREEEYSAETLQKKLTALSAAPVDEMVSNSISDIERFAAKAEQHDDMTLLVVKII